MGRHRRDIDRHTQTHEIDEMDAGDAQHNTDETNQDRRTR